LEVGAPFIGEISSFLRLQVSLQIKEITRKDSLDLDDGDRQLLLEAVERSGSARIVVTHGTDTLLDSAAFLASRLDFALLRKAVVFTGSFVPGCIDAREAAFNLGFALAVAQTQPPGIYVAIGGHAYLANEVVKDTELQRFIGAGIEEEF